MNGRKGMKTEEKQETNRMYRKRNYTFYGFECLNALEQQTSAILITPVKDHSTFPYCSIKWHKLGSEQEPLAVVSDGTDAREKL